MDEYIFNPSIPYIGPIHTQNFSPGYAITIKGSVPKDAQWFTINIQCGSTTSPPSDVAVQVAICIPENYISLNSLQNGVWDNEPFYGDPLIKCNDMFTIVLICDTNKYKVSINGQHYCEFNKKIHDDYITHLVINGDVLITQISYNTNNETVGDKTSSPVLSIIHNEKEAKKRITTTVDKVSSSELAHPIVISDSNKLSSYKPAISQLHPITDSIETISPTDLLQTSESTYYNNGTAVIELCSTPVSTSPTFAPFISTSSMVYVWCYKSRKFVIIAIIIFLILIGLIVILSAVNYQHKTRKILNMHKPNVT